LNGGGLEQVEHSGDENGRRVPSGGGPREESSKALREARKEVGEVSALSFDRRVGKRNERGFEKGRKRELEVYVEQDRPLPQKSRGPLDEEKEKEKRRHETRERLARSSWGKRLDTARKKEGKGKKTNCDKKKSKRSRERGIGFGKYLQKRGPTGTRKGETQWGEKRIEKGETTL